MAFVTIFDQTGSAEMVVFPKLYRDTQSLWIPHKVIMFKGRVDFRDDRISIVCEKAIDLEAAVNR